MIDELTNIINTYEDIDTSIKGNTDVSLLSAILCIAFGGFITYKGIDYLKNWCKK